MNMIEGWRNSSQVDEDGLEWLPQESALEAPPVAPRWPRLVAALVATLMTVWTVAALWLLVRADLSLDEPLALLTTLGASTVPLVLGALLLLAIRQSDTVTRRRIEAAQTHAADVADRLDATAAGFGERMRAASDTLDDRADRWVALTDELAQRTGGLTGILDGALSAIDDRIERLDSAASGARRDLAAVLVGLPKADRQTRELAGSLRDAGLTAHEGAKALDAQLGLLRHRAGEADEVATAASTRLSAQLAQIEDAGRATGERLYAVVAEAGESLDGLIGQTDALVDRSAERLAASAVAMRDTVADADEALQVAEGEASARLAARLDLLDERLRGVAERLAAGDARMDEQVVALDGRVAALGDALASLRERGTADLQHFDSGLHAMDERAASLAERIGTGDEAMTFALGRAESLLGALDAAARELDETLPASFGRFERLAGDGFERLATSLPDLERYHALSLEAADRLAEAGDRVAGARDTATALADGVDARLSAAADHLAALGARADELLATVGSIEDDRAPRLVATLGELRQLSDELGQRALASVEEAAPLARDRLVEAVTQPVSDAIERAAEDRMAQAAAMASDSVVQVERAAEQLRDELDRIEATGRRIAERADSVLVTAAEQDEAGFSRRIALLIEALNSTAIDVAKVLSNDVSDTAWSAYLKGDRGVFTRRAVRLLDSGEAREIARAYDDDGEFRGQVNRFVHDFEALLRSVLADANGSPMAVTLLSSDTGKLYVALAQAIERLRD